MQTLGTRLKALRLEKGITQAMLSRMSGVSQGDISKLENGSVSASTKVAQLAEAVGCDALWLATGEVSPERTRQNLETLEYERAGGGIGIPVAGASEFLISGVETDSNDASASGILMNAAIHGRAVRVIGDQNAPALKDGQFLVLQENAVPDGEVGLFHLNDGRILLRELIRSSETMYHLDLVKWGGRHTVARREVRSTEHVVAIISASCWRPLRNHSK